MNIILFGPPGSGKGTQSKFIINRYNLGLISPGEILRNYINNNDDDLSLLISNFIDNGNFVPDDIVIDLVKRYLYKYNFKNGYLFDGFPRNLNQAISINDLDVDFVIEFCISRELILDRLLGRRVHLASGRVYHIKYFPPKINGIDDITGEKLVSRTDDITSIIDNRLLLYNKELFKLRNFYKNILNVNFGGKCKYYLIDSSNNFEFISNKIISILESN